MQKISVLLIISLSLFSCSKPKVSEQEKQKFYEEKGYTIMSNRLKPEIVNVREPIFSIKDIGIDDSIAAMDQEGQFGIIKFDEDLNTDFNPVVKEYPAQMGIFKTDPETRVMWLVAGRGIYTLDVDTKAQGHTVVSNDGNAKVIESFIADKKNKILLAGDSSGGASTFTLFDVPNNKKIYSQFAEGLGYNGIVFPFYDNQLLGMDYMKKNKDDPNTSYVEWYTCDLYMKTFKDNELTKVLNKYQIVINHEPVSYNINNRMTFGYPDNLYRPTYIIKWDKEIKDVAANPIALQMPGWEKYNYSLLMLVSFDGNWMKTTLKKPKEGMFDVPEILIYHLSDIYPQGISMPIHCGLTKEGTDGAFFKHKKLGPCFVEFDIDNPKKLFVYKLNDGLKILAEDARKVVAGGI
jgi:hypothetical protein